MHFLCYSLSKCLSGIPYVSMFALGFYVQQGMNVGIWLACVLVKGER